MNKPADHTNEVNHVNRRLRLVLAVALAVMLLVTAAWSDCHVTILHFNDFHGHLRSTESNGQITGGLARIATVADDVRNWNDDHGNTTLFLEAGDVLQGTPMSTVYQGLPDVQCLNAMDLDAMCLGNHEFDFGCFPLAAIATHAKFPLLCANVTIKESGNRLAPAYHLFELADGTRTAVFGLVTPDTAIQTLPTNVEGLEFSDPVEVANDVLSELEGKADFIIALTHLGYEQDRALAEAVPEIDVIIGGHSHTVLQKPAIVGNTLICQAGSNGAYLGQLDMFVKDGDVARHRGFLNAIDGTVEPDPQVQQIIAEYAEKLDEKLQKVIAHTEVYLDGRRETVRTKESNLGNLVADIYREYTGADIAAVNGGSIRAPIEKGPITAGDILTVLPFGNIIATKPVKGSQVRRMLEFCASQQRPFGGFLQVSGMSYVIDGNTLVSAQIGGEPLEDDATYTLATSEFLFQGGDGYEMLKEGPEPTYLGYTESTMATQMLREMGTVSPQVEGRITIK